MMATVLERIAPAKPKRPEAGTVHWFNECVERGRREAEGGGFHTEVAILTPGLAGELLRRNPDNRHIRKTKVAQFTRDILADRFQLNGEAIKITPDGLLNDGQHRATAVIEANRPITTLFIFGVERETRTTLDQGASRGAGDYLSMDGVQNATTQASITRQLLSYERTKGKSLSEATYVTNAEVLDRVARDPKIAESAHFATIHAKAARHHVAPAIVGLCHYILADLSEIEANEYLTQVCTGEGLTKRDPAYAVRDRLLTLGKSRQLKVHAIFRGWNAYRQGKPLSIVKVMDEAVLPAVI